MTAQTYQIGQYIYRGVASISYKGVRSSEDLCLADTNSPIGHHIASYNARHPVYDYSHYIVK